MTNSEPVPDAEFLDLVADQHSQLRAFVRMLGVDPDWVDDIAQEVFLVALREMDSFDRQKDLGKWLRGIARNLVRNEVRKQARRQRILHRGLTELLLDVAKPEEVPEWVEAMVPPLRDCVEQLPSKSRQLVAGRYGDGWKAPDLAEHMDMTAVAVRQALTRIRRQLKHCIELRISETPSR